MASVVSCQQGTAIERWNAFILPILNIASATLLSFRHLSESYCSLRKHAYSTTPKNFPPKYENFQIKYSDIFHILAQNLD